MSTIDVSHVTKEYRLGTLAGLGHAVRNVGRRLRGRQVEERTVFKALDDVTFSIDKGEVVGIIGSNGAGKSTLLKILSKVTIPSVGSVSVNGTVAPLIEVGAGLNPELTGHENIILNGAILGIPRREITKKIEEIVTFAELEDFIGTPVKRYSSGMKVRLGFAIATSVDAEVLIVDEVLAVGDLAFQRKCFDRMEDLIRHRGKTVLLVSHNIRQVERLCTRVILLEHGRIAADGSPPEVCTRFYQESNDKTFAAVARRHASRGRIKSSGEVEVEAVEIVDEEGGIVDHIESGGSLRVRVIVRVEQALRKPEIVVGTHTTDFVYLTACSTASWAERPDLETGTHSVECVMPSYPMAPGVYCVRVAIFDQFRRSVYSGETLSLFSVVPGPGETREAPLRLVNVEAGWELVPGVVVGPAGAGEGDATATGRGGLRWASDGAGN